MFSGVFSDDTTGTPGSLTIATSGTADAGSVTLSGVNTYTGTTTINSGAELALSGSGSIATSSGVVDNGVFNISGTTSGASIQTLSGSGRAVMGSQTLALTNAAGTFSGVISGSGGLTISGGTETLSGTNTYTGPTHIGSGATLSLSGTGAIADSSEVNDHGTLNISGTTGGASIRSLSGSGSVVTASGKTLTLTNAAGTFSGAVSGAGALKISGGTETLLGSNTHSGGTQVDAGATLSIASGDALGTGTLALVGTQNLAATLHTSATTTIANAVTLTGDPVFNVASGTTTTISSVISGTGDIEVTGGGTLSLSNANTYAGPTIIDNGSSLALNGNVASIAPSSAVTNNGTLDLRHANPATVTLNGAYTQGSAGTLKMAAVAPGSFQQITVGGTATLDGTLDLTAAAGNYALGRYPLITASGGRNGAFSAFTTNLASVTPLGYLLGYSADQVYLYLTPNAVDTLQEIRQNAAELRSLINTQAAVLHAGLSYDCTVFDENHVCVSAGGRFTSAGEGSMTHQGGLLILGYRPTGTIRVGLFADQSLDINTPNNSTQSKNEPTLGLFANWAVNKDGTGLNLHASAAFSSSDLTTRRTASTATEAGQGKRSFHGQAYEVKANLVQPISDTLTAIPYIGLRYTRIANGAYTEATNTQVMWPVSYQAMAQDAFSVVAGVNLPWRIADKLTAVAGFGVQQNLSYRMGRYAGTSTIPGLASFDVAMAGKTETLGNASLTASYDLSKKERLAVSAMWQALPSFTKGMSTVMATWTMGF